MTSSVRQVITKNFFSKKMYSGGCTKGGEFGETLVGPEAAKQPNLILFQVKLDYIPDILRQTRCPEKVAFRLQRVSNQAKSAVFDIFFGFSNITAEVYTGCFFFIFTLCEVPYLPLKLSDSKNSVVFNIYIKCANW